jgi:4-diphosphocytidyl-2-C-methyl-D-erythritol kinase
MIAFPNCKINLGLFVTEKRPDGYHNIESLMFPVPFYDILEILPSEQNSAGLDLTGLILPGEQATNICLKAYRLLLDEFRIPGVQIHLHKVVPPGAGLGGGSSDGAFTLKILNKLFSLGLSEDDLEQFALRLGSDCPFFIKNIPALASGRGDILQTIPDLLNDYFLGIVMPGIHVRTSDAYAIVAPIQREKSLKELYFKPISEWSQWLVNDFEIPVVSRFPEIEAVKNRLKDSGALYASMSGSGSAVFGIFKHPPDLRKSFPGMVCWQGHCNF